MNRPCALLRAWSLLAFLPGLIDAQYLVPSPAAVFTAAGPTPVLRGLVAELNGNSTPDLVYSDGVLPAFHVSLDPAVNGLATAVTYATTAAVPGAAPAPALATGDIDGDGFGDVVAALGDPMRQVRVWHGTASGALVLAPAPLPIADGAGAARVALPLPADPNLHGVRVFAQWAVLDPAGGSVLPGPGLAYSPSRAIILW